LIRGSAFTLQKKSLEQSRLEAYEYRGWYHIASVYENKHA